MHIVHVHIKCRVVDLAEKAHLEVKCQRHAYSFLLHVPIMQLQCNLH